MKKIYLNASNQSENLYAYGGTNEEAQMRRLANEIHRQLQAYDVLSMVGTKYYIADKAREAKAWGADFSIALHSNAGSLTASGAIAFYNRNYAVAKSLAEKLVRYVDEANPGQETHSKAIGDNSWLDVWNFGNLGIPSMLFEVTFHSNPEEAEWIVKETAAIAKAMVRAIVEQFSLKLKANAVVPEAPKETSVLHRVQVGAFSEVENARRTAIKLKAAGYPIYPVIDDGLIKIQTGAFAIKAGAEKTEADIEKLGFDAWITTKEGKPFVLDLNEPLIEAIKKGDRVRVQNGSVDLNTGRTVDSWVYRSILTVLEVNSERIIVSADGRDITGVFSAGKVYKA